MKRRYKYNRKPSNFVDYEGCIRGAWKDLRSQTERKTRFLWKSLRPRTLDQQKALFTVCLTVVTALADTICIKSHGAFANIVTGNTVRLSFLVAEGRLFESLHFLSILVCYFAGGVLARSLHLFNKRQHLPLLAFVVFCLRDVACFLFSHAACMPLLSIGFGLVNAECAQELGCITNAITGHVTTISNGLADSLLQRSSIGSSSRQDATRTRTSSLIVVTFILSMVVCSWSYQRICLPVHRSGQGFFCVDRFESVHGATFGLLYAFLLNWYNDLRMKMVLSLDNHHEAPNNPNDESMV
jgi:uncharacterized membrane protein YoaK (UPF0700 family)